MIVVVARLQSSADQRDQLIGLAGPMAAASRAETGCIDYRFYADTEDPASFCFVEQWEDMDALKAHFGTPHMADFMQAVPGTLTAPPDVKFHTVASTMGMEDVAGG